MKKIFITLMLTTILCLAQTTVAQQTGSAQIAIDDTTAIEAVSDTTDTFDEDTDTAFTAPNFTFNINDSPDSLVNHLLTKFFAGISFFLIILFLSPLILLVLVCYLLYKNNKLKQELRELRVSNGETVRYHQPRKTVATPEERWHEGIRLVSIGLGLAVLFVCVFGVGFLFGVALFIAIYGAGQMVDAKIRIKS